jgi:hypothetical protein
MAIGFAAVEFVSHTEMQIASDERNHNNHLPECARDALLKNAWRCV